MNLGENLKEEYGGCLPLETQLKEKTENPFNSYDKLELNCGRVAIYLALCAGKADTIWIPYYMCPTIVNYLQKKAITIKKYHIDSFFFPKIKNLKKNEMILWADYYGCMFPQLVEKIISLFGPRLILDCTQSFFSLPKKNSESYYVYSIRKFIGVPEGAYLVRNGISNKFFDLPKNKNGYQWEYLKKANIYGSNAAYKDYLEKEKNMDLYDTFMEKKTRAFLEYVDWNSIKKVRIQNFRILHKILKKDNQINLDFESETPYIYPLLTEQTNLREYLIKNKIYVPQWWKEVLRCNKSSEYEKMLAVNLIPLPIDQRYSSKDMEQMASIILDGGIKKSGN